MQVQPTGGLGRIPVLDVAPVVGEGRWPAKAVVGETVEVSATVFREGHEMLGAAVVLRGPDGTVRPGERMSEVGVGLDRWAALVTPDRMGEWSFRIEAWGDPIAHWWHDAQIKIPRGQDAELMLAEGAALFTRAARGVPAKDRRTLARLVRVLSDGDTDALVRLAAAKHPDIAEVLDRHPLRDLLTVSDWYPLRVDRQRALYGAWYEFFPRSEGAAFDPMGRRGPMSGTFRTAMKRLPAIADMGFDVVYLPPIHPIGTSHRKGPNNTLDAGPYDPGSPWAIGSPDGGHDAIHPDLGTIADFDAFVAYAADHGLEIALDLALQCSPDHPWVSEHPEWFTTRADGTIAYAENPPKKYQDIYPLNFDNDPEGLYTEVKRILHHWMDHGVRIFRVDNPHTKPVDFWERLLADIAATDPDVLFLAEAFTRPAMMHTLGKIGFHQSYTYFTWRNSAEELTDYFTELTSETAAYMRPNAFTNTPDILNEYLQHGGRPAFEIRAVLAALLSPTWGIYSGYELCENTPVRPGSEEYRDSEKYQYRPRDWEAADRDNTTIAPLITQLNTLRKLHPALQQLRNLRFHHVDQPELLAFSKRHGDDVVLAIVNLNPHQPREATVHLDLAALGLPNDPEKSFTVVDQLDEAAYTWRQANYVRLDPHARPAHVFTIQRDEERPSAENGESASSGTRAAGRTGTGRPVRDSLRAARDRLLPGGAS
ncbi:alpha-1,4-glucan--maltose-1-phosphate maltosyltransferase [Actinomadura verrucosospora]|uniref:Alpha-1,4-glucan:maltose-1-phosphate maltosyltransferase n=1 Tax=Actinomadura verrucosospora TaxID=46165 RepID=A0A7D3VRA5_ACTVE|nr:alpha-1,4-glucan--maltose-1-phosphate maltosyltransferase [Actinomadura verrucosospora]QKG20359.1 Alpha-1,4-glucan:maltose-1-phosphate maltosyltransferase 2 [Actinomadura verrucosospora]